MTRTKTFGIGDIAIRPGTTRDLHLEVSQRYTGDPITLPMRIIRAKREGPTVFVSAAVHGDELNGTGIVHDLMFGDPLPLVRGTVILIPVLNIFGFETQERYMPDRRDLNRCFPGSSSGSLTSRVANIVYREIIQQSDYGIDLHTAAVQRTNYPNVRGDLTVPGIRRISRAFGCELILNSKGPDGSLRREATKAGCPTIILEAGEPFKIEPSMLDVGVRGVRNVLVDLDMLEGKLTRPPYQVRIDKSTWVRAEVGGILRFHVGPGAIVVEGEPIATNANVFGEEQNVLVSPTDGIILGMATLPMVKPGEPVCHIAVPTKPLSSIRKARKGASRDSLHHRMRKDLATNVSVSEHEGERAPDTVNDEG
ncbi:MAG: succinylglutamate desuccinylase/aspartoacylase family protein [Myxococcales bacterium]|nr:succinylglutamate desuccinylase/aspartoacylase family protein [Myxococcales bacterium]